MPITAQVDKTLYSTRLILGLMFISCLFVSGSSLIPPVWAQDEALEPSRPLIQPWGYPLDAFDSQTRAQDDFYRYANGGWLDAHTIPADRSGIGFSVDMRERNEKRMTSIMNRLLNTRQTRGSDAQKMRDLYLSYINEARIERLGLRPFARDLAAIRAINSHDDIARIWTDPAFGMTGLFRRNINIDAKNPDTYTTILGHAGLALPDRTYYLRDDPRLEKTRTAYRDYMVEVLVVGYLENPANQRSVKRAVRSGPEKVQQLVESQKNNIDQRVAKVFALENEIAKLHWTRAERRNATRTYNEMTLSELKTYAPDFPWAVYLQAIEEANSKANKENTNLRVIIREKQAFPALATLFAQTPLDVWRDYLLVHYISANAPYMPRSIDQLRFTFFETVLAGRKVQRDRPKRALGVVDQEFNQALGKLYIETYFPEKSKTQMEDMFEKIRAAYKARIENLTWMSAQTKKQALFKLANISAKIAYPQIWRDYSRIRIKRNDLFGNIKSVRRDDLRRSIARLSQKVDKREWVRGPQTVNAFYSPTRNEVFIPAGYIQSPLFDPDADPALNYGAIGAIIGHEIGHAFDDQGSKYDAFGNLKSWWQAEDRKAFDRLGDELAKQYDSYEVLPGLFVNGRQTLGENIGDLAGMIAAYDGYHLSLGGQEAPLLMGADGETLTGDQRFFLGRAQGRRFKRTDAALRRRILSAPHSPMSLRVNGVIRNMDEWYKAFDVMPGDDLYLSPQERVRIW